MHYAKNNYLVLGLVWLLAAAPKAISAERVNVDLGLTEGNASVELYLENAAVTNTLIFSEEQKLSHTFPSYQLLQQYYDLLVDNKIEEFIELLSTTDGTRETIVDYLLTNPDAYARYSSLDTVKSDMTIYWGSYLIHSLQLSAGQGKPFNWREVTQCLGPCVISNTLDQLDIPDQLFIEAVEYLKQQAKTRKLQLGERKDFNSAINIFPSGFKNLQNISQYPMRFYFEPSAVDMPTIDLNKNCGGTKYTDKDVTATLAIICGIKQADLSTTTVKKLFSDMGIQIEEPAVIPVIKNVVNEEDRKLIAEDVAQNGTLPVFQTLLPIEQYVEAVKEWDSVQIVAKAFRNQRGLVYFKPSSTASSKYAAIQSMGIVRHGEKRQVLVVSEYALGQLPVSAFASDHLSKVLVVAKPNVP